MYLARIKSGGGSSGSDSQRDSASGHPMNRVPVGSGTTCRDLICSKSSVVRPRPNLRSALKLLNLP